MNPTLIAQATTRAIDTFGSTAHQVINAYRDAGARLHTLAEDRWDAAFKESAPKLSAETRKNAAHLQKVCSGYYARGIALTADGAKVVVDTLVGAALATTERAAAFAAQRK